MGFFEAAKQWRRRASKMARKLHGYSSAARKIGEQLVDTKFLHTAGKALGKAFGFGPAVDRTLRRHLLEGKTGHNLMQLGTYMEDAGKTGEGLFSRFMTEPEEGGSQIRNTVSEVDEIYQ